MRIESRAQFEAFQEQARSREAGRAQKILVCCGTGCLASGSKLVAEAFAAQVAERGLDAEVGLFVKTTGCHGFCERGPLVVFQPSGILYTKVKPTQVEQIIDTTVIGGEVIPRLLYKNPVDGQRIEQYAEIPFYKHQTRVAMRNIGRIDPTDLEDAVAEGAYSGLARALFEMTPDEVLEEVAISGQRGRGGAGFQTARKWRSCKKAPGERRFVLCNGDEGDPGAFKDRSIMEGDPHCVLEGMVIGAYAVGAHEGFIYVRDEYPLAVVNLTIAIDQARAHGLLGKNILGTGFDFDVTISRGGGAFVCGESSALMRSLEGKSGEPRAKYVHSTDKGLFDLPTVLNNVETWAGDRRHHPARGRLVRRDGNREVQGHQGLLAGRQGQEHRPDRAAHGHHACATSSSTSAAGSSTTGRSRRCRPAAPPAAACRSRCSTCRSTSRGSPRRAR